MRKIEVFSAGCAICDEAIARVQAMACPSCNVEVVSLATPDGTKRARAYGIRSAPTVVVDGKVADCCAGRGIDEAALRRAGVGVP
ncbi:MAG: thioredoxin family protein [Deltaproteobacteria bacterium]|nr:thioredoxin family protein [Deltaproteobacteria bacterium]